MSSSKKKESKLHRVLRMTVIVDKSFEQLFTMRFTPVALAVGIGASAILLIAGVTLLIAFTGLREYIPGYPTGEERLEIIHNLQKADSLANEVALRDNMLHNLRIVLSGEDAPDGEAPAKGDKGMLTKQSLANLNRAKSDEEAAFLSDIESDAKYDVEDDDNVDSDAIVDSELESTFFFSPLKGVVTDRFGVRDSHLGVDVTASEGTPVMSALAGTVVFAEWTVQTGYVIMVQHDNQLLSIYKHNARLLKRQGGRVKAGEAIALVGNSGELTTGPHLHFELWYKGAPLNPENYIEFENSKRPGEE